MKTNKNRYVIDKGTYEKHIQDEVHLYGMLHQLASQAERIKDEEEVFHLLDDAKRYGRIADEMFDGWGIPGYYLVFGEKKDLAALRERELTKLSSVLAEYDAENMEKALTCVSWNLPYIIHGSSFRLLIGSIYELLGRYLRLVRKIQEVGSEKDFLRLQKNTAKNSERAIPRMCRSWGVPEDLDTISQDILEDAVRKKHLIPIQAADMVVVCGKDDPDDGDDFDDPDGLDDLDSLDKMEDLDDPGEGWDE